jgi:hypothetical protein
VRPIFLSGNMPGRLPSDTRRCAGQQNQLLRAHRPPFRTRIMRRAPSAKNEHAKRLSYDPPRSRTHASYPGSYADR